MSDNSPVYAVATYQINDFDAFMQSYAMPVHESMSKIGAEILSASGEPDVREGSHDNNWSVVLKFPSAEAFDSFYNSAAYQALLKVRQGVTDTSRSLFYVLPKFAPPAA